MRIDSDNEFDLSSDDDFEFDNCLKEIDSLCEELSRLNEQDQILDKSKITSSIDDIDQGPFIENVYPKEYILNTERRIQVYHDLNFRNVYFSMVNIYYYLCGVVYTMKNSKIYTKHYH